MSRRTKHLSLEVGLLSSLLMACPLAAYSNEEYGQSIIVSSPDNPDHLIKLRPFVRNRQLPSRAQMAALHEERAQLAERTQSQAVLNGQVSAFANSGYDPYTRPASASHYITQLHKSNQAAVSHAPIVKTAAAEFCMPYAEQSHDLPAVEPAGTAADNNQNFSFLRTAEKHLSSLLSHPPDTSAGSQTQPAATSQFSETLPGYPAYAPAPNNESMTSQPLSVSSVAVMPSTSATSGFGSAGPPPFPLSLLPAPVLKQLVRSMAYGGASRVSNAPQSNFGAWHNSITFSPETPPSPSGSPLGNFRLYSNMTYASINNGAAAAPQAVTRAHRNLHARKISTRTNAAKLFSYPAYPTYSYQSVP